MTSSTKNEIQNFQVFQNATEKTSCIFWVFEQPLASSGAPKWWFSTPWQPVYEYIVPGNWPKTSSCQLPYQLHSSYTDCATELFKPSNDSASSLLRTRKKCFGWGLRMFCEWHHKWSSFWDFLPHVTWPRAQPLGQSISLKFSLETRLESESFEPLIDFPTFLVQKLWYKKQINLLSN